MHQQGIDFSDFTSGVADVTPCGGYPTGEGWLPLEFRPSATTYKYMNVGLGLAEKTGSRWVCFGAPDFCPYWAWLKAVDIDRQVQSNQR